ncbi:glycosyltransferase [Flagellimonas marinaquae]|uniref:glycosyltransferase n=1 Tax=Flagellimonas marinaquae TaxID=254955 RepID=UPI0020759A20|nr:glycosyltransferase [Allomuricauda aquimarina]USD24817.1 glycosyltransferase [Allomuricauda aquimarina]
MTLKKDVVDWLTIVSHDANGGAEQTQKNIISYLCRNGKKCHVIILRRKDLGFWGDIEDKCKIVYFPFESHSVGYLFLFPYLLFLSTTMRFTHVFSSQTLINGIIGFYKRIGIFRNSKIIVRESTSIFQRNLSHFSRIKYLLAYKLGYPSVDLVICQTNFMKVDLVKRLPLLEKKVHVTVIPNPIDIENIEQRSMEKIPMTEVHEYIVTAGRLIPEKGYDILIDSFAKIRSDLVGCKLYILGRGAEKEKLQNQVEHLGLKESVIFMGLVDNVYPYFKNAKLCVVSSRVEGFPNVLLQMMSQNENVATTLCAGGISEIPGIYTCEVEDHEALAKTILHCHESDNSEKRQIFNRYLEKRGLDAFLKRVELELEEALSSSEHH